MNVTILEACAVNGIIAGVGIAVVVVAREVTKRAAAESSAEAVMPLAEAAAQAGVVKLGPAEAAHVRASESPELGGAAYAAATKPATNMSTTESAAHVAAPESSSASSMTTAAATTAPSGGHGVRPHC
jgi:hypothetical protein